MVTPDLNPLGYCGIKQQRPPNVWLRPRAPLPTDAIGYDVFDLWGWQDVGTWQLISLSGGVAVWLPLVPQSNSFETDDSVITDPIAGLLQVQGLNGNTTQSGGAGIIQIVAPSPPAPTVFVTDDSVTTTPVAGVLTINGGNGVSTKNNGAGIIQILGNNATNSSVVQVFTSSGIYTPTSKMQFCTIECVGGGGAGGSTTETNADEVAIASGGSGGGYSRKNVSASTIGASQVVTIGAGGTQGASGNHPGNAGGTTSVGAILSATGGSGGQGSGSFTIGWVSPSAVGVGIGGDVNLSGGYCGVGIASYQNLYPDYVIVGSSGGNSQMGQGGFGGNYVTSNAADGTSGTGYGSGGSGGYSANHKGSSQGGVGSPGIVIITEYVST